jgi:mercuric ion transport protein
MANRRLLGIGIGGSVVTAICCFTPALAILLGALGFAVWLAWLDYVLVPLLVVFLGLTGYALLVKARPADACATVPATDSEPKR